MRPCIELLENATFSAETLRRVPVNFEVGDAWVSLLTASLAAGHETYLHHLYLGTHALEVGNAAGARERPQRANSLHPSVHAARALTMLAPTADSASELFHVAWRL
eukprot:6220539-Prymnesium_polylepis.2